MQKNCFIVPIFLIIFKNYYCINDNNHIFETIIQDYV